MSRTIPLTRPDVDLEELKAVQTVFQSGMLAEGEVCSEFERKFAAYIGCRHAIATSSGSAALHLAVAALDIGNGDEVIVPDFNHPAAPNAVLITGATPVLADIDPRTFNINPRCIPALVSDKTRAIIVVHQFGLSADLKP
ncbi:MAG TPA: aminotransferase class I/II-fold pyridoxal phosphate-dependent enzyme, partial [Candidatus Bathyarchaeia archaeon]|nr:aminotransferase class I/II-fold pyridoxal phosphate-dependent enzyme [Candidatus Bathyarchaeia archaeon]